MFCRKVFCSILLVLLFGCAPAPTPTPQPTATVAPTATPEPTATPVPTSTPQPTPTLTAESLYNRASESLRKGDLDRAIADLDRAIQLKPDFADAYALRGNAYNQKRNFERALTDHNQAIKLNANKAEFYYGRGVIYFNQGQTNEALADQSRAIKLDPNYRDAYFERGYLYYATRRYDEAIAEFDQALKLKADSSSVETADVYYWRGVVYEIKKDFGKALADLDEAIRLKPNLYMGYIERGNIYDTLGNSDRAIAEYEQAIKINPNNSLAYYNRGYTFYRKRDFDRAIADFDQAIRLEPKAANAFYYRGLAHTAKGNRDQAIADLRAAHSLATQNPTLRSLAELALAQLGASASSTQTASRKTCSGDMSKFTPARAPGASPTSPAVAFECQSGEKYYFVGSGFQPQEFVPPSGFAIRNPENLAIDLIVSSTVAGADGLLVLTISFEGYEWTGQWSVEVSGSKGSKAKTEFAYAPLAPRLVITSQKSGDQGATVFSLWSGGWSAGESLTLVAELPGGRRQTQALVQADKFGLSSVLPLQFYPNTPEGDYVHLIQGKTATNTITITCKDRVCKVKGSQ